MQIDPRSKTRILEQFRTAIDHQIQVWDQTKFLAEDLGLESDDVLSEVQAHSITADNGMDFKQEDLEEFLIHKVDPTM
jgi:hypothetical protein